MGNSQELGRFLEIPLDFKSTTFAELLTDFARNLNGTFHRLEFDKQSEKTDPTDGTRHSTTYPVVLTPEAENLGRGGDGTFLLQFQEHGPYLVRFGYDYPQDQTHYFAVITKVSDDIPMQEFRSLDEEKLQRLVFHRQTTWDQSKGWHKPTVASEEARVELFGEDEILTKFFHSLPSKNS